MLSIPFIYVHEAKLWPIESRVWLGPGTREGTQVKAVNIESQLELSTCRYVLRVVAHIG